MDQIKISVVIITKNRVHDLLECLGSLASQSGQINEIIVIDNNSTDDTNLRVKAFSKAMRIPIHYFLSSWKGFAPLRNTGLWQAKYEWVAFIDDDCVADSDWYENLKKSIFSNFSVAAIMGETVPYNSSNIWSLIGYFNETTWKKNKRIGKNVVDFEVLDTKNIVYNRRFLKNHRLEFDESRAIFFNSACADCDLGMQIQQSGGIAMYEKLVIVAHKNPTTFLSYLEKSAKSFAAYRFYEEKWGTYRGKYVKNQHYPKGKIFGDMKDFSAKFYHKTTSKFLFFCLYYMIFHVMVLLKYSFRFTPLYVFFRNKYIIYA